MMLLLGILASVGLAAILWAIYGLIFCRNADNNVLTVVINPEKNGFSQLLWVRCFFAGSEIYILPEDKGALKERISRD